MAGLAFWFWRYLSFASFWNNPLFSGLFWCVRCSFEALLLQKALVCRAAVMSLSVTVFATMRCFWA